MFCSNCGTNLPNEAAFCHKCGNAITTTQTAATPAAALAPAETPFATGQDFTAEQLTFYKKTYITAGLSFLAWIFIVLGLFDTGIAIDIVYGMGKISWLLVIGIFWGASYIGERLTTAKEKEMQFLGLGIYVAAYAVIFLPLISIVIEYSYGSWRMAMDNVLIPAFISTFTVFAALTVTVFATKTDFSFLRTFVIFGSFFALGAIIIFSVSGAHAGSWFAIAMIILMSATILYQTDQIKTKFDTTQHIGAGAMIFASFMVLLWYIIRLFISRSDD